MIKKTFLAIALACVNIIFALAEDTDKKDKMNKITQTAGRAQLGNFAPDFAHFNDDVLFGENWNNTDIDLKTRSIITVVSLISLGITDNSLKYHLENAKKNGVSKTEIAAIITHNAFYAGWPKAWAAFNLAKSVWTDGTPAKSGKEAVEIKEGTVINIPAGVKHWHGAAADNWFSHLAVEVDGKGTSNEWLEPVDDDVYDKLK